jgi:predicted ArsR family transcriptional regulator
MVDDFRRRAVRLITKSYTRVRLSAIAGQLRVSEQAVESILTRLLLDGVIGGKIDQVGVITLGSVLSLLN